MSKENWETYSTVELMSLVASVQEEIERRKKTHRDELIANVCSAINRLREECPEVVWVLDYTSPDNYIIGHKINILRHIDIRGLNERDFSIKVKE